jgi:N-carbamoylputrescine amidase
VLVTACQMRDDSAGLAEDWDALAEHCNDAGSDLVVLPEMPFAEWVCAAPDVDPARWDAAVGAHDYWMRRLGDLGAATVLGTRPVMSHGARHNEAFVWTLETGAVPAHHKRFLPDEEGFWEATWYEKGDGRFPLASSPHGSVGFLVCTELWFPEYARDYGRGGAVLLAVPRATPMQSRDRWVAAGRAAAVVAGAFCVSSNRSGTSTGIEWAGTGWVVDPDGVVLGHTTRRRPFVTVGVDPEVARAAQHTYPRYVR